MDIPSILLNSIFSEGIQIPVGNAALSVPEWRSVSMEY